MNEEKKWVEWIARRTAGKKSGVKLGIGDDAAVLRLSGETIATVDSVVEGVHFDRRYATPAEIGHKALAVNLSDCAAMGARPRFALVSLGIPRGQAKAWLPGFYQGLLKLARRHGVAVVGGNLSSAPAFFADIAVLGETPRAITRGGARVGDAVFLLGNLGEAAAGLAVLRRFGPAAKKRFPRLCRAQLKPTPLVDEGVFLRGIATSLVDVSDGLGSELELLARYSHRRIELDETRVPISAATKQAAKLLRQDPLPWALSGGEDYALLFTAPARAQARLRKRFGRRCQRIGTVKAGRPGVVDVRGKVRHGVSGFSHF